METCLPQNEQKTNLDSLKLSEIKLLSETLFNSAFFAVYFFGVIKLMTTIIKILAPIIVITMKITKKRICWLPLGALT